MILEVDLLGIFWKFGKIIVNLQRLFIGYAIQNFSNSTFFLNTTTEISALI